MSVAERNWAAVAHGSAALTLVIVLASGGSAGLLGLLVPLVIYAAHYRESEYVAHHALQALAFQAAAFALAVAGGTLAGLVVAGAWIVSLVLSLVVIGLVLIPVALGITVACGMLAAVYPFAAAAYGLVGAYRAYHGEAFEYVYIGAAVRRQQRHPGAVGTG